MNCPLCKNKETRKIDVLVKRDLTELYNKFTANDFDYLIDRNITYFECQRCKLRYYDPPITGDEKFYNALQKFEWYYLDEKDEYAEAAKYIRSSDKVLDVGSGKGSFAKCISTKDFIGLDSSAHARDMATKVGVVVLDETIQNFAKQHEEQFDVVTSFQVLEHVLEPDKFLEAKIKALKVGGKMIVAVPSESSFLTHVTNGILNMPPHHVTRWSDETLVYIADQYKLKLLKIQHEEMQNVHKLWYIHTFIQNSMLRAKLVDTSLVRKITSDISNIIARILVRGAKKEFLPHGHTVMAIYGKK